MRYSTLFAAYAFAVTAVTPVAAGENVYSSNIHAVVAVKTYSTNVLISVPWTFYDKDNVGDNIIPVRKLVMTSNLDEGDMLLSVNEENRYETWMVKREDGCKTWVQAKTFVKINGDTECTFPQMNAMIERGLGLWLLRGNPKNNAGEWKDVYLYGQYAYCPVAVTIDEGLIGTNAVMVANPDCTTDTYLNGQISFDGVAPDDTLSVPNGTDAWNMCLWDERTGRWYYSRAVRSGRRVITSKCYDIILPAGTGFWYIKRGTGEVRISFQ